MNKIFYILKRELESYFYSPIGYIVMTSFLLLNGIIFWVLINALNSPMTEHGAVLRFFFGGNIYYWIFLLIFIPVITMKLIAEEIKNGTIEILITTPITETQILLGKYLGALFFYILLWIPSLVYIVILLSYSMVDIGPILSGYLGTLLIGGFFISIGLLCSSLTKSQISAAILTFVVILVFFLLGLLDFLTADITMKKIISFLSLPNMMDNFSKGIIDTKNVIFLVSLIVGILLVNIQILNIRKWES